MNRETLYNMWRCLYFIFFLCLVNLSDFVTTSDINLILENELVGKILNRKLITNNNDVKNSLVCSNNPEDDMTVIELIRNSGYPAEEHFVTTEDGYILGVHRIRGEPGSPAVLLQHGLMDSSFAWIALGKAKSLAYKLSDRGYDVWLANVRGNTYSRNHTTILPSNPEFWNFSYHEVGVYDLPAVINYIRSIKNDGKKLMYVGHSMGTTEFFVMASERPDVAVKIEVMFALAPAAYIEHVQGFMKLIEAPVLRIQKELNLEGKDEIMSRNIFFKLIAKCVCNRPIYRDLCVSFIFNFSGYNYKGFDKSLLPVILSHTPAGTSLKTVFHLGLGVRSKKFQQYDYQSPEENLRIYNSTTPPDYDLGKIQVPIVVFWAENDFLTPLSDIKRLWNELPNKIEMFRINDPDFTHLDFTWGLDAPRLLHPRLFHLMETYRKNLEL